MRRTKEEIFNDIYLSLKQLVEMAAMDTESFWLRHLQKMLEDATLLKNKLNLTEEEIRDLCETIRSTTGSPDNSFWEYEPLVVSPGDIKYSPIEGTEKYPEIRDRLYSLAEEIRTVEKY